MSVLLLSLLFSECVGDELSSELPAAAQDILELRTAAGVRPRTLAGLVEDITGDSVVFRRADGGVQVVR